MSSDSVTVGQIVDWMNEQYPPTLAEDWDAVGLVVGRPESSVQRVLVTVDVTAAVVEHARSIKADVLIAHHPLMLSPVHAVAATTPTGTIVQELIESGCALFTAHTNADRAHDGVSDALAQRLELHDLSPLEPAVEDPTVGLGRVGTLPSPMSLTAFTNWAAQRLPASAQGIRVAGDLDRVVRTVAVCGGSGDSAFAAANAAGVDAYVTADLKHHRTSDHLADAGCAVLDVGHWTSERPWCDLLVDRLGEQFDSLDLVACDIVTDPWTLHIGGDADAS